MKLLRLTGKEQDLDYVIANILFKSGIQLEDALKVLDKGWKLSYFTYNSEIKELLSRVNNLMQRLEIPENDKNISLEKGIEEIKSEIQDVENKVQDKFRLIEEKQEQIKQLEESLTPIEHLKNLDVDLGKLYNLRYMNFRYGKMSLESYQTVQKEINELDAVIYEVEKTDKEIWIMYFMPDSLSSKVDSYFQMMKFERVWLPNEVQGKPCEFINQVNKYIENNKKEIEQVRCELSQIREEKGREILKDKKQLELLEKINRIKKYMAHDEKGSFYVVGWIPTKNLNDILPKLDKMGIEYVVKSHDEAEIVPPTKLKNNKVVKPFEEIVKMYGTPNYTEMDPTVFVAITAFIMFGFMFGDVGQGLVIALIGLILWKKKVKMGPIFIAGGISAIIFGFLYGSFFGSEEIIKGILPSPMDNITNMLVYGIATGAILIIIAMIFNIKNGIKNKDKGRVLFDKNGLAGLIFYVVVLAIIVGLLIKGKMIFSLTIAIVLLVLPLILILFKEKIENAMNRSKERKRVAEAGNKNGRESERGNEGEKEKEKTNEKEKVSFVEKIFELIEMLLSMASNTISFVRLAAFAINHVGLCLAVYILGDMIGGSGSYLVYIIGNVIVIGLEGLIVAIQVLRLEYYELFSRFYSGDGKEYVPIEEQ